MNLQKFFKHLFKKSATKTCVVCGKKFKTKGYATLTCSEHCKEIHRGQVKKNQIKLRKRRKTIALKKQLAELQSSNSFVAKRTSAKKVVSKPKSKMKVSKTCVICGRNFETSKYAQKVCSSLCKSALVNQVRQNYKERHAVKG